MAPRLNAIILAAGLSSRMGELKAALPLGQGTVLEQCVGLFRECGIDNPVVVTGHRAGEIEAIAQRAGASIARNPDFAAGMYSSIRTGVRHLDDGISAFFLLPVDIPLVRPGSIRLLARSFADAPAAITYPVFAGRRGHPPLIGRGLIPAILGPAHPKGGLRTLLARLEEGQPGQVAEVTVADANIHCDLDSPEDYRKGRDRFSRRDFPTMDECTVILRHLHPMPEKGLAHGRLVAEIAVALCMALPGHGCGGLDAELCRVGGWLHDIAKGAADHERQGGRWLRELGFGRAAEIVAAHRDPSWQKGDALTEKELVSFADKLARGNRMIGIDERFQEKLALYKDMPDAVQAIRKRYDQALLIKAAVEDAAGQGLDTILAPLMPCSL